MVVHIIKYFRYDVRNKLEDKAQFGLKPNLPHRMTDEEVELEEELDKERYRCLGSDVLEEELEGMCVWF